MFDTLEQFDRTIFLHLNGLHTSLFDQFMFYVSQIWVFAPLFFYWIYLVVIKEGAKKLLVLLAFIVLLIILTDQTSNIVKHSVKRYRPTHNTEISTQVHTVNGYKGGQYGFFSGHASNTFGIATLLFFILSSEPFWFRSLCFVWAGLTAYSRIYLGVHYPSDIFVGMLVGIMWGLVTYKMVQASFKKFYNEDIDL